MCYCKLVKRDWLTLFYGVLVQNGSGNSHVMGATVAMERSIEFRLLDFFTLCLSTCFMCYPIRIQIRFDPNILISFFE